MFSSADFVLLVVQYKAVERVLADRPTVVMMAHVNPLKDIVTAIRAAKIIVEEYKIAGVSFCHSLCCAACRGWTMSTPALSSVGWCNSPQHALVCAAA